MENTALINENELVARACRDVEAFAQIYDHYFSRVYNYIYARVNLYNLADDITSQVFEKVLRKINTFNQDRGSFAGWLFTIVHNDVTDCIRQQRYRRWLPLEASGELVSTNPGPEEMVEMTESRQELRAALTRLADRERNLIGLKFWAGLTNRQIAAITGLTESNVGVILYRTIRRLRAIMGQEERKYE